MSEVFFPPEWYPQSAIQITWPHINTDWGGFLDEVVDCYITFSKEILKREKLIIACSDAADVKRHFSSIELENLLFVEVDCNDTWARDHGPISLFIDRKPCLSDFGFNGWGLKFAANYDNQITSKLFSSGIFNPDVSLRCNLNFILEGGSVESDGKGTLLTTSQCLFAPNRNQPMSLDDIEAYLKQNLGVDRVLWLHHGYLAGDDTDNHIDTLARFCDEHTIAYVKCDDKQDEHYDQLKQMEKELRSFVSYDGKPYRLIDLPMADAVFDDGERLPATYANFLIINGAVLVPFYGTDKDRLAAEQLRNAFPDREVIGVDCSPLIRQHGSLHCVTMQYPFGFL